MSQFATTLRKAAFARSMRYDQTTPDERARRDAADIEIKQRAIEWYDGLMKRASQKPNRELNSNDQ